MNILQHIRQQGTAVVMITHNLNLITEYPGTTTYKCEDGNILPLNMQQPTTDDGQITVDC